MAEADRLTDRLGVYECVLRDVGCVIDYFLFLSVICAVNDISNLSSNCRSAEEEEKLDKNLKSFDSVREVSFYSNKCHKIVDNCQDIFQLSISSSLI